MKNLIFYFQVISLIMIVSCVPPQDKKELEKNGIKIEFTTTQAGKINNNEIEIIGDMNAAGVFIFIPEYNSIVIRHESGQDELLKVNKVDVNFNNDYTFSCSKSRVLFVNQTKKIITYTVKGKSAIFVFPINEDNLVALRNVLLKFKKL